MTFDRYRRLAGRGALLAAAAMTLALPSLAQDLKSVPRERTAYFGLQRQLLAGLALGRGSLCRALFAVGGLCPRHSSP